MENLLKLWAKSSAKLRLTNYYAGLRWPAGLCPLSAATAFAPMFAGKSVNAIVADLQHWENFYFFGELELLK